MIRPFLFISLLLTFCISCSSLPEIQSVNQQEMLDIQRRCNLPYVTEETQFVHSIEAVMPGNNRQLMTGITSVFPGKEKLESVLLTLEGLVLFHAVYDRDGMQLKRGVPPFDSRRFATGMLEDIRLIFIKPGGNFIKSGRLKNGNAVCRFKRNDDHVIDVEIDQENNWKIILFDPGFDRQRSIETNQKIDDLISRDKIPFPATIRLQSHGLIGYSLNMKLIRVESQNR